MAIYYWVGGTGTWDTATTTNWSLSSGGSGGAGVPTSADDAIFNSASSSGSYTVTLGSTVDFKNLTFSGPASGTLSFNGVTYYLSVWGGNYVCAGTGVSLTNCTIFCTTGSGTITITSNNVPFTTLLIARAAGTDVVNLGSAMTASTQMGGGTFNTNNYAVTGGIVTSSTTVARNINLGASVFTVTGNATPVNFSAGTSVPTVNASSSTFNFTNTSTKTLSVGTRSITFGTIKNSGAGSLSITSTGGVTTIGTLMNGASPSAFAFSSSQTINVTNFSVRGTAGNLVTITSTTAGTAATLSKSSGIVSCNYLSLKDSAATGGATWYAGANSTNVSGNSGWIFTNSPPAKRSFGWIIT